MLTEKKKADRLEMAQRVKDLCDEFGAACEIDLGYDTRAVMLDISMGEFRVGIDFDGASKQPNVYCMPWNMKLSSDAKMTDGFGIAVGATVNPYHKRKCMVFVYGIDDLLERLRRALQCIADGEAYTY